MAIGELKVGVYSVYISVVCGFLKNTAHFCGVGKLFSETHSVIKLYLLATMSSRMSDVKSLLRL